MIKDIECNPYILFIQECIEVGPPTASISNRDMYREFEAWHRDNLPLTKIPFRATAIDQCVYQLKHITYKSDGWYGIRFKTDKSASTFSTSASAASTSESSVIHPVHYYQVRCYMGRTFVKSRVISKMIKGRIYDKQSRGMYEVYDVSRNLIAQVDPGSFVGRLTGPAKFETHVERVVMTNAQSREPTALEQSGYLFGEVDSTAKEDSTVKESTTLKKDATTLKKEATTKELQTPDDREIGPFPLLRLKCSSSPFDTIPVREKKIITGYLYTDELCCTDLTVYDVMVTIILMDEWQVQRSVAQGVPVINRLRLICHQWLVDNVKMSNCETVVSNLQFIDKKETRELIMKLLATHLIPLITSGEDVTKLFGKYLKEIIKYAGSTTETIKIDIPTSTYREDMALYIKRYNLNTTIDILKACLYKKGLEV